MRWEQEFKAGSECVTLVSTSRVNGYHDTISQNTCGPDYKLAIDHVNGDGCLVHTQFSLYFTRPGVTRL